MPSLNTVNIYVVKPKEATNMVTNPSIEKGTTGYTAVSSTIARTNSEQRRGAYCLEVTPSTGVDSGVYFGTVSLTAGTLYTFSVDVKGVAGQAMRLQVRNTSGVSVGGQTFTATGYWQRVSMTYTETVTNSRRLYVMRDSVASTDKFYLDGLQMEAGAESTYFDGDMKGYVRNRADFRWLGAAHASQSWRSGNTKKGGELVNLKTLCNILGVIGLGMTSLSPQALETTLPGSLYQRTSIDDREFSIPVLFGGDNFRDVALARKSVIDLIRPDAGSDDQPITMVFETVEANGTVVSERASIAAHYTGGLEMKITGGNQRIEKATLNFKAYLPFIVSDGSRAIDLGVNTTLLIDSVAKFNHDGTWENFGPTISANTRIVSIVKGPDGMLYMAGKFINLGGDANADGIVVWDGVSFSSLGTGVGVPNDVYDMVAGPDGKIYVMGNFTSAGGVANTAFLAAWNGTAWESVATISGGVVRDLSFTDNGDLYIGGSFTTVNGITCNGVAKRINGTWSNMGVGINTADEAIAEVDTDGESVYFGGTFAGISGVTVINLAKYSDGVFSALGTGITSGAVSSMRYDRKRARLYICGNFQSFDGVAVEGIGYWTGSQFIPLATNLGANTSVGDTRRMSIDNDGTIYLFMNSMQYIDGIKFPDRAMRYVLGQWMPLQFLTPASIWGFKRFIVAYKDPDSEAIYFGMDTTAAETITVNVSTIESAFTTRSYPVFTITGPGSLWEIKNYTTRQVITFTGLTLVSGEILTLDLTPGQISFTSNYRGNMMRYIVPGSNLDLFLQSGVNNVSAFMTDTTAASEILMTWQDTYWSLDGTVR